MSEQEVQNEDEAFALGWLPRSCDGVPGWQCVWCQSALGQTVRLPLFRPEDVARVARERTARDEESARRRAEQQTRAVESAITEDELARRVALMDERDWSTQTASERVVRQLFEDLELLEPIGRGGAGSVFRARWRSGGLVAAKVLRRDVRRHPEFRARIALEIELLGRLNHPGIVRLLEHREAHDQLCFVMELVEGTSLVELIRAGPVPREDAVALAIGVLEALAHAHERGVLHRDVKPSNVIVDRQGRPRLLDFGIGRLLQRTPSDAITDPREVVGTKGYIPPEALAGREVDARADIYAVGVLLYELLTGQHPETSGVHGVAPLPPVGAGLDEVLARAVAVDPERRFGSAGEMAAALRALT